MSGFGNPLSFKAITDVEIKAVEDFIKKNTFGFLTKKLCDISVDNECEVIIDDEHLIDYFGPLYANDTASFQFQPGDVLLIKEMVNYVKSKVDEGGPNKNCVYFMDKRHLKQRRQKQKAITTLKQIKKVEIAAELDEKDVKSRLIKKLIPYFEHVEIIGDLQFEELIKLQIKDTGKVYGNIYCAICKAEGRKNKKPIRVYCNFEDKPKGSWVVSNLVTHLNRIHNNNVSMNVQKNKKQKVPSSSVDIENKTTSSCTEKKKSDDLETCGNNDASVILMNDDDLKTLESKNCDTPQLLYDQLSKQITMVMGAVLKNSDAQSHMHYVLENSQRKLMVATIAGDGNCIFSALTHQIFLHKINTKNHKDAAKKLRADVVEYILSPDNFPLFLPELKDRVYELKNKNEIADIETECKMFVRHILSKNKFWGAKETLLATSDLYATNIIVFDEDGTCFKFKRGGKNFCRSIAIAYRLGSNEEGRNHYDSVCDVSSIDLFAAARSIA